MKLHFILLALFMAVFPQIQAQVTIGSAKSPDKGALLDLKEKEDGTSQKGLLLPRVALVEVNDPSPLEAHIAGMYVYNTTKGSDLEPGNYFNDGTKWHRVKNNDSEPWFNSTTHQGATSISDDIYHLGSVAMGLTVSDASAQVDISSGTKGVLIPRMSRGDRDKIANPANSLMIFNTSTNCLNYYNAPVQKWLSMCGTYDPAIIELVTCTTPVGPQGTYTEGAGLSTVNTYTLVLNVTEVGSYEIIAKTTNGYAFSKSGLFTSTGSYTVVLEGQGVPLKEGEDEVTLTINSNAVTPSCVLPKITVGAASTRFTINCTTTQVFGEYVTKASLNSSNYIEVFVNVTTGGDAVVETASENGIRFSTGAITVTTATTSIKLFGQGTPSKPGTFTGNTFTVGANTCTPSVTVVNSLGGYDDPANRCQEILDIDPNAADGYYWVKEASTGNKFKTYCDMESDGAWTLVKSLSERQILVVEKSQAESIGSQKARNSVTTREGKFNEYAFSLTSATVNNIGSSVGDKKFRFSIKEKGHTTSASATYEEIESSTVSPNDDVWAQDNHWNVTIYVGNPATGNFSGDNYISEGKFFGKTWGKTSNTSTSYTFDGIRFAGIPPGMYSSAGFFTGFYGVRGYVGANTAANNVTYTYHGRTDENEGKTFTYNKYEINDLYGLYMNSEPQFNHHIGTCSNSTDDFGGASFCAAGWARWRAHNFNQRPDATYEGRIVQYWVK